MPEPWELYVIREIRRARLALVLLAPSEGLAFEIGMALKLLPRDRIVFLLPPGFANGRRHRREGLSELHAVLEEMLHHRLPPPPERAALLYFDPAGKAHYSEVHRPAAHIRFLTLGHWNYARGALRPVLAELGFHPPEVEGLHAWIRLYHLLPWAGIAAYGGIALWLWFSIQAGSAFGW